MTAPVFPPEGPPRMTAEEIGDLARRVVTNEVYLTNTKEGYELSFPLILMAAEITREFAEQVGAMYAPWSSALSRSINGYPMMTSASFVHRDDLDALFAKIDEKKEALA